MNDTLREWGLVAVAVAVHLGRQQVNRTFVVSADADGRPDAVELEKRVEEWKREQRAA